MAKRAGVETGPPDELLKLAGGETGPNDYAAWLLGFPNG
jgi:hypothetical protein